MKPTIGLFGTCGKSTWRDKFIDAYTEYNISCFNPQVPEGTWHPGCIDEENKHLMHDDIILFPITSETTGQGSLAEIGFSCQAALRRSPDRYFIFMINDTCDDSNATEAARKDSVRTRALVQSKVLELSKTNSGIYVVNTLDQMLELSIYLYECVVRFRTAEETVKGIN